MKLLQINSVYNTGSTGKICKQIHDEFMSSEIGTCKTIYFWGKEQNSTEAVKCGSERYAKIMALKSRITGEYGFVSQKSTRKAIQEIEDYKPDIIHLHNIHDHSVDLRILFDYLRFTSAQLIWTFHDCWAFTGYCGYYSLVNCGKWETQCKDCPLAKKYSWFIDKSGVLQERKKKLYGDIRFDIITPSKWLAEEAKKSFVGNNKITVINNGVNLSVFKPTTGSFKQKYNIKDKKIVLGVAYQWDKRKGLDVFYKLAKSLDEKYVIVLVGNMNNSNHQVLPTNIVSINRTSNQNELAEIYTAADVFVNPTREEVFGLVNIEALACGTPVITFNSGGSPECIDSTCGIVVEADDFTTMRQKIVEICQSNVFRTEDCIRRAQQFDSSQIYSKYISYYSKMV